MISTPQVKRYPAIFDFVTQRLEYLTFNEGVGGSNPPGVTTLPNGVTTGKNSIGPRRSVEAHRNCGTRCFGKFMFGWPSGLGSRLQNEIGRFDSDSKLKKKNTGVAEWFRQQSPKLYG